MKIELATNCKHTVSVTRALEELTGLIVHKNHDRFYIGAIAFQSRQAVNLFLIADYHDSNRNADLGMFKDSRGYPIFKTN